MYLHFSLHVLVLQLSQRPDMKTETRGYRAQMIQTETFVV